jgi:hypothetical protein
MSDNENKDGLDRFIRDERSPLAKMLEEKRVAHREFEFDGAEGRFAGKTFAVRALSAEERMRAVAEATRFLVNELKLEREDLYTGLGAVALDLESKVRCLAVGLIDPKPPHAPLAKNADQIRQTFEDDEITVLFEHLADYSASRSPLQAAQSWEEVEGLLTALGKGWTSATSLNSYGVATLRYIVLGLAKRLYGPTSASSSDTSPPSGSAAGSSTNATAQTR